MYLSVILISEKIIAEADKSNIYRDMFAVQLSAILMPTSMCLYITFSLLRSAISLSVFPSPFNISSVC